MSDVVLDILEAAKGTLQSIAELRDKTFHIMTEEELLERAKVIPFPAGGIVYEGLKPYNDEGTTHRVGAANQLFFSVVIFYKNSTALGVAATDTLKPEALELLGAIRQKFLDTRAPNYKFWQFAGELPVAEKNGVVVWIQRWSLPVTLI